MSFFVHKFYPFVSGSFELSLSVFSVLSETQSVYWVCVWKSLLHVFRHSRHYRCYHSEIYAGKTSFKCDLACFISVGTGDIHWTPRIWNRLSEVSSWSVCFNNHLRFSCKLPVIYETWWMDSFSFCSYRSMRWCRLGFCRSDHGSVDYHYFRVQHCCCRTGYPAFIYPSQNLSENKRIVPVIRTILKCEPLENTVTGYRIGNGVLLGTSRCGLQNPNLYSIIRHTSQKRWITAGRFSCKSDD